MFVVNNSCENDYYILIISKSLTLLFWSISILNIYFQLFYTLCIMYVYLMIDFQELLFFSTGKQTSEQFDEANTCCGSQ